MKSKEGYIPGMDPTANDTRESIVYQSVSSSHAADSSGIPGLSKSAKKNAKRKEKKKQQKGSEVPNETSDESLVTSLAKKVQIDSVESSQAGSGDGSASDIQKRIRNLRKKIKQINELQAKIDSGEIKEPTKEQLEKLSRKDDLEEEMEDLTLELQ